MGLFPVDEVRRKTFHLLSLIYVAAYWFLSRSFVLWGLASVIIIVLLAEAFRLRVPSFNKWILYILGGVHRNEETNRLSGLPWTLAGSFFTMLIFPDRRIVLASFLFLAFGDSAAALVGKSRGKRIIFNYKSLEGSFSCFAVCFIIGLMFFSWPLALVGALTATLVELLSWQPNDNFWMPLVSATVLTLLTPHLH